MTTATHTAEHLAARQDALEERLQGLRDRETRLGAEIAQAITEADGEAEKRVRHELAAIRSELDTLVTAAPLVAARYGELKEAEAKERALTLNNKNSISR